MLIALKFILSDGIVLWRAWVLWNRRFILFIPPLIFILCTLGEHRQITRKPFLYDTIYLLVISVASAVFTYESTIIQSVPETDVAYILVWCIFGLTISTNIWSTCLIFIRAWYVCPALVDVHCMMRSVL